MRGVVLPGTATDLPGTVTDDAAATRLSASLGAARYPSLTAVYSDVIDTLIRAHTDALQKASPVDRSLAAESLDVALQASWEVVEKRLDEHLAAKQILLAGSVLRHESGILRTGHEQVLTSVCAALDELTRQTTVTWNCTTDELARFLLASFDGLITDYALHQKSGESKKLVRLVAVHLALHARARNKNGRQRGAFLPD